MNADVGRADAPVHKPHLMHGLHPPEHRLEHRAGLLRRHSAVLFEPLLERTAAGVLHDGVDRVVLFKDVQHRLEAVGRGDALDEAVEVGKVHPGGLEQHLAAGLRAEDAVLPPLCGQRQGHILLDGHAERPGVLDAPVEDALAVHALDVPHRIPARQHRARGETARRVAPCKLPAAVGALCSSPLPAPAYSMDKCAFAPCRPLPILLFLFYYSIACAKMVSPFLNRPKKPPLLSATQKGPRPVQRARSRGPFHSVGSFPSLRAVSGRR